MITVLKSIFGQKFGQIHRN